jgi:hypothetical protein
MAEWEIHKPSGTCSGSGRAIEPGEDFIATLVEAESGFERRDYAAEYWMAKRPTVYCYWKSTMPKDDNKVNFRFALTLVLMRKRLVKYDSSQTVDGKEMWTVKITGRNETADVVNPQLTEDKIEQLSNQLGQILQVEFDG